MNGLRFGVVGTGHLGFFHARAYSMLERRRGIKLSAVCDVDQARVKDVAKRYGAKYFFDYRDMLDEVDAVSIAVPTSLHHQVARFFLSADKHVLIEKPLTATLAEADELLRIAEERNLILQVGHIERFNPAVLAVVPYLKKPKFIECQRLGSIQKKGRVKDVGVVLDLMIHDIDIILSLVNSRVKHIEEVGISTVSDHEDMANVRLTFQNNAIADITASRVTKEETRKLRIFQKDSYILLDYMHREAFLFNKSGKGMEKARLKIKKKDSLKVELKSFIDCVRSGKRPIVSGTEGRQALSVALAILDKINGNPFTVNPSRASQLVQ